MFKSKSYKFSDGCNITFGTDNKVEIHDGNDNHKFDNENKPVFTYETGEVVTEYSGLATDHDTKRSWAKAEYPPNVNAPLHFHNNLTEDYYIVKGQATVRINDEEHIVNEGEHIQVQPGQNHQVINTSSEKNLVLIVKCVPAWTKEDFNLSLTNNCPAFS